MSISDKELKFTKRVDAVCKNWKERTAKAEAQVSKLESAVAAVRTGLKQCQWFMRHLDDRELLDDEIAVVTNRLLADPNPGARVEAVVDAAREWKAHATEGGLASGELEKREALLAAAISALDKREESDAKD